MAWDGSGGFDRVHNWVNDRDAAIDITASRMDAEDDGFATGLENCVAKDGQNTATANLPMGNFRHTGVGDATALTHYASANQVVDGALVWGGASAVGTDAYAVNTTINPGAYLAGNHYFVIADVANTGACTINIFANGAKAIKLQNGNDPYTNAIIINMVMDLLYDGTNFLLMNPNIVGKQTIFIPVAAMTPTVSNGCTYPISIETTAGRPDMNVMDFDASADEHAQFQIALPKAWDLGTVAFQAFWTTTATDADGIAWGLQGVAVADNGTIDVAYGTAIVVTDDNQSAAEDQLVTAESAAVTIAGSPAVDEMCFFRVFRDVSDANDDMAEDARLIGIKLHFTTNAVNDV
jgi:hypothetical protein